MPVNLAGWIWSVVNDVERLEELTAASNTFTSTLYVVFVELRCDVVNVNLYLLYNRRTINKDLIIWNPILSLAGLQVTSADLGPMLDKLSEPPNVGATYSQCHHSYLSVKKWIVDDTSTPPW